MRILIVEDDRIIANNIALILIPESYAVDLAFTASEGYQKACDEHYDVILLDWMLPDGDGMDICARLRKENVTSAILMVTAKNQLSDRIEGLDAGSDDYITKPFQKEELLARVRAATRRSAKPLTPPEIVIRDLVINTNTHQVIRNEKHIPLSPKEFSLLRFLATNKNQAVDRMTILSHAWDEDVDLFSNTVDVHIRFLRKKIDDPYTIKLIKTIKGKGYMLCDN
jgi:DNA-binding response OmpR family regulator